ncbi:hypothetical protein BC938DRAFT_473370 [Jimgerdemannia flammicorona]|uniref:Uncharacterized protein n=1 Tax=Jimgerdemannia flammicorona TaxID=994334 RepID=A0A433Q4A5_9FUNG|nr:hypothetical protein BC938DRAFT_473370 [Jimgerdemannia flammicorona]
MQGDKSSDLLTVQEPFSSWTFAKIRPLFGLTASCSMELSRFQAKVTDVSPTHLDFVIEDIIVGRLCLMAQHLIEYTRANLYGLHRSVNTNQPSTFSANAFRVHLYSVAAHFDGDVKVIPQFGISGSRGKGPVGKTEAKRENIDHGVGQNAVQLQALLQCSYENDIGEQMMYGIVSSAVDWVIKVISNTDFRQGDNVQVLLSSLSPVSLPFSTTVLTREILLEPVMNLVDKSSGFLISRSGH